MKKIILLILIIILLFSLPISVYAHSGRTDSSGGHRNNSNGEYHYHCGGHPAHQHKNGICPYRKYTSNNSDSGDIPLTLIVAIIVAVIVIIMIIKGTSTAVSKRSKQEVKQESKQEAKQQVDTTPLLTHGQTVVLSKILTFAIIAIIAAIVFSIVSAV